MKKVLYFAALLLGTTAFVSCEKEDIENTATVRMAGQWYVQVDAVDNDGNPINGGEDYFGEGKTILLTYNTAGNSSTEMWIDNMGIGNFSAVYSDYFPIYIDLLDGDVNAAKDKFHNGFEEVGMPGFPTYSIKTKVTIDQNALTFNSTESENFGEGYQWWTEEVELDEKGDTVWADDEKTEAKKIDVLLNEEKGMPVTIEGKILKGAGRQNNGSVTDSIVFFVTYKDDPWYPVDGYTRYKVSGIRYSGLVEND
ncbi:MAG: hypothetical protein J6Z14_07755 [Prevotella sp.]|nr:hypothetical protein [Prevotella sp.]